MTALSVMAGDVGLLRPNGVGGLAPAGFDLSGPGASADVAFVDSCCSDAGVRSSLSAEDGATIVVYCAVFPPTGQTPCRAGNGVSSSPSSEVPDSSLESIYTCECKCRFSVSGNFTTALSFCPGSGRRPPPMPVLCAIGATTGR